MIRVVIVAFIAFLSVGCSVSTPAVSEYRIDIEPSVTEFTQGGCKEQSLKVAQAFSSSSLMSHDMNYGQGNHKQYTFTQSEWAESPNRAITAEILEYVKATKLFKNVQNPKSRSRNEVVLEINIEEFMQHFSEDEKKSFVKVSINLTLIDVKTSKVLATKTFNSRVEVDDIHADAGVKYLNIALEKVLVKSGEWLGEVCK